MLDREVAGTADRIERPLEADRRQVLIELAPAGNFAFDTQQLDAVGSVTRLATPGWDSAPDRWSNELTGGASELSVTEL